MQKNAKESKRTQENARSFIKNAKNARERTFFYKERKSTRVVL